MLRILLILSIVVLIGTTICSFKENDNRRLTLSAAIKGRQKIGDENYLIVKTVLTNVSSTTFTYHIMSCFYPYSCETDSKNYSTGEIDCIKNIPKQVDIAPNDSLVKDVYLLIHNGSPQLFDTSFRVCVDLPETGDITRILYNRNESIVMFYPNHYVFTLYDTSYRRAIRFGIIDHNGNYKNFDTVEISHIVWSNKIR